jgi:hypothetical protein
VARLCRPDAKANLKTKTKKRKKNKRVFEKGPQIIKNIQNPMVFDQWSSENVEPSHVDFVN